MLRIELGGPVCECGAQAKRGYFHLADSHGWPVTAGETAHRNYPGYREGQQLWDGHRVVCSRCARIYDAETGAFLANGTRPQVIREPEQLTRRSEEAERQHRSDATLAERVRRKFRRRSEEDEE
jgi:hypothetical protein